MPDDPDEAPDTASIIDTGERLLAESRALLANMSAQLGDDGQQPEATDEGSSTPAPPNPGSA